MINEKILHAYDAAAPDSGAEERIWKTFCQKADSQAFNGQHQTPAGSFPARKDSIIIHARKDRPVLRWALSAAACIAVVIVIFSVAPGIYQKWFQPNPASSGPETGISLGHSESNFPVLTDSETDNHAPAEGSMDSYCIQRAMDILHSAGRKDYTPDSVTVQHLGKSLSEHRDEIIVSCQADGEEISVYFDAEDGVFLKITGYDWIESDNSPCVDEEDAAALATRFYESLPVEQGYKIARCNQYDEACWDYDFCREVEPGLYSWCECVRIRINPETGEAKFHKAFYVPLLDDHQPEDIPLTEAEALEAAGFHSQLEQNLDVWESVTIKKAVEIPYSDEPAKCPGISRICWKIEYHEKESEDYIAGGGVKHVDYYTGEVFYTGIYG